MYSDKKCVVCGKVMKNVHHLKKYCSNECISVVRKQKAKAKNAIRKKRDEEFQQLPEETKLEILMEARKDIMESLKQKPQIQ